MRSIDLAFAGVSIGAIAALSGIGLLVTYRTNGVLNIAQGGIAALVAYVFRAMVVDWQLPVPVAALLSLAVVSPLIGIVLERFVFRPLARRRASAAESLVASLGVLVLTVGMTAGIWGLGSRNDAPSLFPEQTVGLPGGSRIGVDALAELALVVAVCVTLGLITTRTRFGRQVRAVVDDRRLAELSAIPADRVAAAGWAVGTTLAGFTGILLAPRLQLTPYGLTLLVLETFAVVVAARLASLPGAVLTALAIGILQSELSQFQVTGEFSALYLAVQSNLFVAALLVLLLVLPRLRELGGDAGSTGRFSSRGAPQTYRASLTEQRRDVLGKLAGAVLLAAPLTFAPINLRDAFIVPALALIFLSLVIVTGYSGQISLGVAGYAGLGALLSAKLADGDLFGLPALPALAAPLVGALLVAPVGLLTGYPAIRRRGLALALTTFAVGAVMSRFVFQQQTFVSGLHVAPLSVAGHTLSDRWFYVVELLCLGLGLLVVRNLHEGRLGRALLAVRDHPEGAAAVGVDVRNLKLLSFTVSAAVAGLGGALLMLSYASFDADAFSPLNSLLWFTAVVVFGADSAAGAVVAAGFIVTIDTLAPAGSATLAVGILALSLGWLPGGLASAVRHLVTRLGHRIVEDLTEPGRAGLAGTGAGAARAAAATSASAAAAASIAASGRLVLPASAASVSPAAYRQPAGDGGSPVLTPFGEALLVRVRQVVHTSGRDTVSGGTQ
ncbi:MULTISPECIES: ABC transporter permease [Protofrankia]|uniref:ABC-type transporter, integral membrane subunit n=1 Tax=Candidatus Protofrankia datiscae TaxID=2716812 RepID=F8B094_9ACTN|nr:MULTISPECIES: ABC transporter permease [Protofrankia]AEH08718.1 ABC-type transporter, integral membrane subunit [Candidatus Protofrankia datiscae]